VVAALPYAPKYYGTNPPPNIGLLATCVIVCAKALPKVRSDNGICEVPNWEGPKLFEGTPEDIGIYGTMLFAKKLSIAPIVMEGIP
jgi:hypothetical protein